MKNEKIARLRELVTRPPAAERLLDTAETAPALRSGYNYWAYNASCLAAPPPLNQSPRARAMREINRIAAWRRWGDEVARWLDRAGVEALADLDDEQLEGLRDHMRRLEDCGHMACDLDDDFPAR